MNIYTMESRTEAALLDQPTCSTSNFDCTAALRCARLFIRLLGHSAGPLRPCGDGAKCTSSWRNLQKVLWYFSRSLTREARVWHKAREMSGPSSFLHSAPAPAPALPLSYLPSSALCSLRPLAGARQPPHPSPTSLITGA